MMNDTIHHRLARLGLDKHSEAWLERLGAASRRQVEQVLAEEPGRYRLERMMALVSPAAEDYLEQMAIQAEELTIQRFGRTIALYAPLYLSNYCINRCLYCGFNKDSPAVRRRLTIDQAIEEAKVVRSEGFADILLVSSQDEGYITVEYLCQLAKRIGQIFSSISIEVQQLTTEQYRQLLGCGIDGVTIYQETYDRDRYKAFHIAGPKSDYDRRLEAPDQIAAAGMRRIGLGALLGLSDWRLEALALAEHADYLIKRYWKSHISISFPRLRPAFGTSNIFFEHVPTERQLVQMVLAMRLCFADVGLVLSTREPAWFRDILIRIGITRISAGSKTNPGGYCGHSDAVEQFEVADHRSASQVARAIELAGREPVWKDWDRALSLAD